MLFRSALAGAAGRARAGATASAAAHRAAPQALAVLQADAGEGRPRERSTRRRRRRSDAAVGDGAAAAEQQHLRDPAAASLWPAGQPSGGSQRAPRVRSGPAARAAPGIAGVVFGGFEAHCSGGVQTKVFGTRAASPDARLGCWSPGCHSCSCFSPSAPADFDSAGMALCVHLRV